MTLGRSFSSTSRHLPETILAPGRTIPDSFSSLTELTSWGKSKPGIFSLLKSRSIAGTVWLCLARPVSCVTVGLPPAKAERLFSGDGLPPLNREHVRECLMEELGRPVYDFLATENDFGDSPFLTALTVKARALPLYLHYLIQDIRRGEFDFRRPDRLPKSLDDYYSRLIERFEFDPAQAVLPHIIALLALAHMPLSKEMLGQILDDEQLAQDKDWEEILDRAFRLGQALTRQAYLWEGQTGFILYHESFRGYLLGMESQQYGGFKMAPVLRVARERLLRFCSRWREWPAESPSRRYGIRFYPGHITASGDWNSLAKLLTNLAFLEAKAEAGLIAGLLVDLSDAADCLREPQHPEHDRLRLLGQALLANLSFLSAHPTALFQSLWNQCWWHDCPPAAEHYEPAPPQGAHGLFAQQEDCVVKAQLAPWQRSGPKLHELMERWESERRLSRAGWLRSLRPAPFPLNSSRRSRLHGHQRPITRPGRFTRRISPRKLFLRWNCAALWDPMTGEELLLFSPVKCIQTSQNPDTSSGEPRSASRQNPSPLDSVGLSPDGKMLYCAFINARTVTLSDVDSGELIRSLDGLSFDASNVDFSPDRSLFAGGSYQNRQNTVRIWHTKDGSECGFLQGVKGVVLGVAFSPDAKRLASAAEGIRSIYMGY